MLLMQLAQLITVTGEGAFQCNACQWRCRLQPGETGRCLVRVGSTKGIVALNHSLISAALVGPVEELRLWHFFPDSMVLAVGSWGYAFPADQQRGAYARLPKTPADRRELEASRVASFALKQLCRGVVWTYSEPAVAQEYALDVLRNSRAASRFTAICTSGYLTPETLESFGPYLDGVCLDLRGFGDTAYARLAGVPEWRKILEVMGDVKQRWHCHVEVLTRMHRGVNDDPKQVRELVSWIRDTLGPQTPWHVLAGDAGAETAAAVARSRRLGHENNLQFVYGPEPDQPTLCPNCQATLITRENGVTRLAGLQDNSCTSCGFAVDIFSSIFRRRAPMET